LDFRVLRMANPFGPFQIAWKGQGFIAAAVSRALSGQPIEIWGDGSVVRDFVFIDDVIDAFEAAMNDPNNERVFNIGTGDGRSLRDVVTAIERLLAIRLSIKWAPGRPVDLPTSVVAIDRAKADLGWAPKTPFETGLAMTIEWIRHNRPAIDKLFR
jgi:UDP-glucose 4-epimerase